MESQSLLTGVVEVVVVSTESMRGALMWISGCAHCSPTAAVPLEMIFDHFLNNQRGSVIYALTELIGCPNCAASIVESTLIEPVRHWREPLPQLDVVLADDLVIVRAQSLMSACERCHDGARISFDYLLDAVTGCDPCETEYLMCRRARCPRCSSEVCEKTRIIPE